MAEWNFERPHWVPMPRECVVTSGICVKFDDGQVIEVQCPDPSACEWVRVKAHEMLGVSPRVVCGKLPSPIDGGPEAYEVESAPDGIVLRANTIAGTRWAFYTLRQALIPERGVKVYKSWILPKMTVKDAPKLAFRGIHICWMPETKEWDVERMIRVAAYYKLNYVIIEDWGVFASETNPWISWPGAPMTKQVIARLVALASDLGVTLVPQINVFGHASQSRRVIEKHAVLDLNPQYASLFEPHGGWVWCLTNPEAIKVLKELLGELHEAFGNPPYFHIGCDEADEPSCPKCRATDWPATVAGHINDMRDFLAGRGARTMVWHDMFIGRDDPRFKSRNWEFFYANGGPDAERMLSLLKKDIIVCDWFYGGKTKDGEHPSMDYFREQGFPVVACPWDNWDGGIELGRYAIEKSIFGFLGTTWHHAYNDKLRIEYLVSAFGSWSGKDPEQWSDFGAHLRDVVHDMKIGEYAKTGFSMEQLPSVTISPF